MTLEHLRHDLRFASRSLRRTPALAGAVVLMLALGIAGTTVMFALIRGVLLRPLPVQQEERLIVVWKEVRTGGSAQYPFGNTEIEAIATESHLIESAAGVTRNGVGPSVWVDRDESGYANVGLVTGAFFDVLGVRPVLGRSLAPTDDQDGAERVIVLSNGFWRHRYGASREVLGHRVTLDERSFTIVGVMPPDLNYPAGVEIWQTTTSVPTTGPFGDAARREVNLIARLKPGVTLAQASDEITALSKHLDARAGPNARYDLVPVARQFDDVIVGDVRASLVALFIAVGFVLILASANAANLLLVRGEARRAELAVRAALGADRWTLARHIVAETVALVTVAGAAGLLIAWWSLPGVVALIPEGLPRVDSIRLDWMVGFFSLLVACLTSVFAGLGPVLICLRADLVSELRRELRGVAGFGTARGRRILVISQVAITVVVIAAAGLLIRTVLRMQSVDLGLPVKRLVLVELAVPQAKLADRDRHEQFLDAVIAQARTPDIAELTPVNLPPFSGQGWDLPRFTAEGQTDAEAASNPSLNIESIYPNFFDTLQIELVRGRTFNHDDREGHLKVAIVSRELAVRVWANANPIGKRLKMGPPTPGDGDWYTVVGVAADTHYREFTVPRPTLYLPAAQFQMTATLLVVRTTGPLDRIAPVLRDRLRGIDPTVQVMRLTPFSESVNRPLARPRFNALLLTIFAFAALLLSMTGLHAVMSAYVGQRDRELAVRLALGATPNGLRYFVVCESARLAGVGAVVGTTGAAVAAPLVRGLLFDVSPLDPLSLAGAALLVATAAAAVSYLSTRRATRVNAAAMLRSQ